MLLNDTVDTGTHIFKNFQLSLLKISPEVGVKFFEIVLRALSKYVQLVSPSLPSEESRGVKTRIFETVLGTWLEYPIAE